MPRPAPRAPAPDSETSYVEVDGVRTRIRILGEGPPLLLLHGLGGCLEEWRFNAPFLGRAHRVYVPDFIGHGWTDKPAGRYTPLRFAGFLHSLLDRLGVERAPLVGHSFGGAISMLYATLHPERVSKLVVAGSAGLGPRVSPLLRMLCLPICAPLVRIRSRTAIRLAARRFVARPEQRTEEWVETTYRRLAIPGGREVFLDVIRNTLRVRGLSPEWLSEIDSVLPALRAPVLILHGRQDNVVPVANVEHARRVIPQCQVRLFDPCGHDLPYECAEEFNREVLNFLSEDSVLGSRVG